MGGVVIMFQYATSIFYRNKMVKIIGFIVLLNSLSSYACDINYGFSPKGESLNLILQTINNAKTSIHVAAYAFTSKAISQALINKHNENIDVEVVADYKASHDHSSKLQLLRDNGINVRTNNHYSILHDKFMIIDDKTLQTGSFNYSMSAAKRNAENVIVLSNCKDLAYQYNKEWLKLYEEGE